MDSTMPLVSIILPVANAASTLKSCLESLAKQSYTNLEIIAIDDNSSDASFQILKQFKQLDHRFKISQNKKKYGMAITLNRCVTKAKGAYIAFMAPHDISSPQRIKEQLSFLLQNKKVAATGTQCVFINQNNRKINESSFPTTHTAISETLLPGLSVQPETVMVHTCMLPKDILKFKPNSYPLIYTDVFMKLVKYAEFANLQKILQRHRLTHHVNSPSKQFLMSFVKLWLKGSAIYSFRPSFKTLLLPFLAPLRTRFA